ncbi:hypothetical protein OG762_08615 [Streptomyces sp. NBC_01136]|uniref:hypothetical protein n=1 Tax=unclassified Streptomyces TaxID=2593676 RepID=UPI00324FCCE3|nr:hypothetical protein OG762_08615 [Streptomyces sp. NBC_01136]
MRGNRSPGAGFAPRAPPHHRVLVRTRAAFRPGLIPLTAYVDAGLTTLDDAAALAGPEALARSEVDFGSVRPGDPT